MEERKIKRIDYSRKFLKSLGGLPNRVIKQAEVKERIFKENIFDSRLKTHKLHGKDEEVWAFWIDYHHRIKFIFLDSDEVLFLDIGSHKIYK